MSTLEREHKVVFQISDVHITPAEQFEEADKALTPGVTAHTDNFETLRWILGTLTEISPRPGIIVFSGDVADNGRPAAYRRVRELVEPAARAAGARVMWLPGNHDKLSAFRKSLLDWEPSEEPVDQVLWDGDARVIGLDSSVPSSGSVSMAYGELQNSQLEWLEEELRQPARLGTVLAVHHPPVDSPPLSALSDFLLRRPERLAEVIEGTDVRLVVSGHNHYTGIAMLGSVPVWISPSVTYQKDLSTGPAIFRGVTASGGHTRIDLKAGQVYASQVTVTRDETELFAYDTDRMLEVAAALEIPI